jgi:hypothetical protein
MGLIFLSIALAIGALPAHSSSAGSATNCTSQILPLTAPAANSKTVSSQSRSTRIQTNGRASQSEIPNVYVECGSADLHAATNIDTHSSNDGGIEPAKDGPAILSLLVDLLRVLAWPLAIVIIAMLFRREVKRLIDRMDSISGGSDGWSATFNRKADHVAEDLGVTKSDVDEATASALKRDPRGELIRAWIEVEEQLSALADKARQRDISVQQTSYVSATGRTRKLSPRALADDLVRTRVLDGDTAIAIKELQQLRNLAAHDKDFKLNVEGVMNFVAAAQEVSEVLKLRNKALDRPQPLNF